MSDETERQEIEELLPWHAAGTLNRGDSQRVEKALAKDPELARRFELVREELAGTIHLNETLGAPSARAMDKLFAAIDAEPARKRISLPKFSVHTFFAGLAPRTLAWAGTAAAVIIVLQAGLIGRNLLQPQGATYETASAPGASASEGSFVLIRFVPQATIGDITTFLEANNAVIINGPTAGGFYRVKVANTVLPQPQLTAIVAKLQQDKSIDFIAAAGQ